MLTAWPVEPELWPVAAIEFWAALRAESAATEAEAETAFAPCTATVPATALVDWLPVMEAAEVLTKTSRRVLWDHHASTRGAT